MMGFVVGLRCNSQKYDVFPVDFYTPEQLSSLSAITGLPLELLKSRKPNQRVIDILRKKIVWFFEEFITFSEYNKVRDGKKAADSILHSLEKAIGRSDSPFDLFEEYEKALADNQ